MASKLRYEDNVQAMGRKIWQSMGKSKPSIFAKDYWQGQMMEWSMKNDAFKTEMFRFVDVFPVLSGEPSHVARHLQEYFCRPGQDFPKALQWGLSAVSPESRIAKIAAGQIEKNITSMAGRFIAGEDARSAFDTLHEMRASGLAFTVDLLGEACVSEAEAADYQRRYEDIIQGLAASCKGWADDPRVEGERFPRVNISIKLSALYSLMDPIDPEGSVEGAKSRLRPLFRLAAEHNVFINLDLESFKYKDITLATFMSLLEEPEFQSAPAAGCVVQAYLKSSEDDLKSLIKWAKKKKRRIAVRLVKGAYWDYEVVHALQHGWEIPVYTDKRETDENYETLTALLMDNTPYVTPAIASHNLRSLAHAMVCAERNKLSRDDFEFQMLFGMAEPLKESVLTLGYRLRDYVPVGELVPGMAYLVRRLLENTSNESWLRMGFAEDASIDKLLADPRLRDTPPTTQLPDTARNAPTAGGLPPFQNEPLADFTHASHREAMRKALATVRKKRLGKHHLIVVGGQTSDTVEKLRSVNPAAPAETIGTTASASTDHAEAAIAASLEAFSGWRDTPVAERAKILLAAAELMRKSKWELSAQIVLEVGKQWREADADVAEAIDFLEFYARDMLRLAAPRRLGRYPGELNEYFYQSRGICAVIAPWNFPLAILTGMTAAALVTGNCVLMKPAEQSPVIAAELMGILVKAGVPKGVLHFLPGRGEVVGAHIVGHPKVAMVAFTGSQEVGLEIWRQAGVTHPGQRSLKRVICELGGKNAIIVDDDANLDEAVQGVIASAFHYQGQKCSACSRVIVLANQYDAFVQRLTEATRSMTIGPAEDPAFQMGPVVDGAAQLRILKTIERARTQGEGILAVATDVPRDGAYYVPPTVFVDVDPDAPLAQDEIFGPVLAVIRAQDFKAAVDIALGTPYALTGGVYSRSPANIAYAREHFRVGNLYINRTCTGALVWRQPFGGFARSGMGSKAGGPDYLLQFMEPRVVSENTMRRGFVPSED